jgi:orotate phosphoribosyltransferase
MVAGPELGAIPIVAAVAVRSNLPYAMIRKGERAHGTQQRVEGEMGKGNRVLLIDDVATSGGSLVGCVETIHATGAKVLRVTCVVDRKEGANELLRSRCGIELVPLLTIQDLGIKP